MTLWRSLCSSADTVGKSPPVFTVLYRPKLLPIWGKMRKEAEEKERIMQSARDLPRRPRFSNAVSRHLTGLDRQGLCWAKLNWNILCPEARPLRLRDVSVSLLSLLPLVLSWSLVVVMFHQDTQERLKASIDRTLNIPQYTNDSIFESRTLAFALASLHSAPRLGPPLCFSYHPDQPSFGHPSSIPRMGGRIVKAACRVLPRRHRAIGMKIEMERDDGSLGSSRTPMSTPLLLFLFPLWSGATRSWTMNPYPSISPP